MKKFTLFGIVLFSILGYIVLDQTKVQGYTPYLATQHEAVDIMVEAMAHLTQEKQALGIYDASLDPFQSGLIGTAWPSLFEPSITTTLGTYEAKRISTNPNFAALMVRYFMDLKLREGDSVAINFSGSFPALNLAVMVAVEVMGLNPYVIASLGASTYGANQIDYTWVDMQASLVEAGILSHLVNSVSLGGDQDILLESTDESLKTMLKNRYETLGYAFINEPNLSKNVRFRYGLYKEHLTSINVFINTGGNMVALGSHAQSYPNGLSKRLSASVGSHSGLIDYFLRDDVALIHLLNIRDLALRNGMSIALDEPFALYEGDMYQDFHYAQQGIYAYVGLIFTALSYNYLKRKRQKEIIRYV